jgi:hypothetical protein
MAQTRGQKIGPTIRKVHLPVFLYDLFQKWLYPETRK